ncbi:PAS domain S-box protein [Ostertagia ostertagi]
MLSVLLAAASWYLLHSYRQQEQATTSYNNFLLRANPGLHAWIYPAIAVATLLTGALFTLLLVEIRVHKKIIEELLAQKEHYRVVVHSMAEGLITTGPQGEIHYMNPAAEKLTGWTASEALHLPLEKVYDVVNESTGLPAEPIARKILREQQPVQRQNNTLLYTRNRGKRVVSNSGAPLYDALGNVYGAVLVFNDTGQQNKQEPLSPGNEISFKAVIENLPEAVFTCDTEGYVRLYNKAAAALWGRQPVPGKELWTGAWKILDKDGMPIAPENCPMAIAIKEQRAVHGQEVTIQRPDGSLRHLLSHPSPLFNATGKLTGAINMLTDITARKKTELLSLQAVERYDILLKATSDTIWDWDIVNNRMIYNSGITKMFGYQIAAVEDIFNWWRANVHPDDLQMVMDAYFGPVEDTLENIQQEYRFRCADGSYKYIYDRAFILYDDQQKPTRVIGSMQDITYKKEAEKRFAKAIIDAQEKERRYIGEELHDNVNQLLASAMLTLSMVKHFENDPEKMAEFAEKAKQYTGTALNEIRKLSHDLAPATIEDSTLKNIFENLLQSINIKNQFRILFHFDDRVNSLLCHDTQINLYRILQEQVKNILKYAGANSITVEVKPTGSNVTMITSDDGIGFDTKKTKKGIGLSNMKRRVESLAGKLLITTSPGNGCTITIEVPYAHPADEAAKAGPY